MNIFKYELRQNRKSIIIWSIAFITITLIFTPFVSVFLDEIPTLTSFLEGLGESFTSAMNINIDLFSSPVGFYSYIFTYISLMAAFYAMNVGLNVISKENRMKTADFLMSKPKSRTKIFLSKLFSSICSIAIVEIAFYIATFIFVLIVGKEGFALKPFILINLTFSFIQLIFLSLGIFIATIANKIKAVTPVTMGVVLGSFLIGMLSAVTDSEILKYFTPFKYFDSNYIMINNAYETKALIISITIPIVLLIISYIIYTKKDVPSV